jgi:hypothetical protein
MILAIMLAAAPVPVCAPKQCARIAYRKCGPDGTVDWDENPRFPPPHCNRNGWNGRRYVERIQR